MSSTSKLVGNTACSSTGGGGEEDDKSSTTYSSIQNSFSFGPQFMSRRKVHETTKEFREKNTNLG